MRNLFIPRDDNFLIVEINGGNDGEKKNYERKKIEFNLLKLKKRDIDRSKENLGEINLTRRISGRKFGEIGKGDRRERRDFISRERIFFKV